MVKNYEVTMGLRSGLQILNTRGPPIT